MAEELGDLLFAAVNVSRFLKADPEDVLSTPPRDKFAARFRRVEALAGRAGPAHGGHDPGGTGQALWDQAKTQA